MRFRVLMTVFLASTLFFVACTKESDDAASKDEPKQQVVQVYLVALEGTEAEGKSIGCGDTLVPVERTIETEDGTLPASITGALHELFAISEAELKTLDRYSALRGQDLQVDSVRIKNKRAIVNIVGKPSLGGVCDAPRFYEQIEATVAQFSPIEGYTILLNGTEEAYKELGNMKGQE